MQQKNKKSDLKKMNNKNKTHRLEFDSAHLPKVRRAVYDLLPHVLLGSPANIGPIKGENSMSRLVI